MSSPNKSSRQVLCFQDLLNIEGSRSSQRNSRHHHGQNDDDSEDDGQNAVATAFFELANAEAISYRISPALEIVIHQDVSACGQHTGGIVWETSYLLLNYLRATGHSCQRLLEVGAGCGLVGLGCHKMGTKLATKEVIITETNEVMKNLTENWRRNYPSSSKETSGTDDVDDDDDDNNNKESSDPKLRICELDWTRYREDCKKVKIKKHSVDTIVGTDVVFATSLVEPLLQTMRYLAHDDTVAYLCLQERCKDSHKLLLDKAGSYDFKIEDISEEYAALPECKWGKDLECCLLKFTIENKSETTKKARKGKRKRSKESD
ncbi:unnamed protein product [Cylindrotheca closterium]|uniref:Uncharacterized protein n=1 Tax=Cylindrotheca closterium TaxID=2856 RepID=A0AAD2FP40_9STRA|nr:unnamed protein product [Cylindrotheca closterium]